MKKVLDYIQRHGLIAKGDHVVVGVSGGADSVCLLFLLEEICKVLDFTISVVHVNHHLRGREADRDEAFTRKLCERLRLPFEAYHYNVRQMADEWKVSIEEAGRMARYEAFHKHCERVDKILKYECADKYAYIGGFEKANKAAEANKESETNKTAEANELLEANKAAESEKGGIKIALAHHQNDIAETFIYHLARGTDLAGLSAIRPVRGKYIRPLLCMNRQEIEHYLNTRNIEYVTDSTNAEDEYTRNKIRHHVLEYLEKEINSRTAAHMAETSESLGEIQDFLQELYEEKYQQYVEENSKIFLKNALFFEKKVLVKGVIRLAIESMSGSLKNVSRIHIENVYTLFQRGVGKTVSLPYGLTAEREYQGISIAKSDRLNSENQKKQSDGVLLKIPGETFFENYRIVTSLETESLQEIPEKTYTKWFDYDKIRGNLVLRYRRKGDYLVINAHGGRKKLKDYLINEKIPQKERDQIPLLCCDDHVAWVCGHRISELYKVDKMSKRIIRIQISAIHRK